MVTIWVEQQKHVNCIVDPVAVPLYTKTGSITKSGRILPVYRCARGSNSLESFHSHLLRFIPGTSANAVNFQAYLLDGLSRWNIARKEEVSSRDKQTDLTVRTFDLELAAKFDALHHKVLGRRVLCKDPPSASTKELVGIEYLFEQCELKFDENFIDNNMDDGVDSGLEDEYEQAVEDDVAHPDGPPLDVVSDPEEDAEQAADNSVDAKGIPCWHKVDNLARALIQQEGISITDREAQNIIDLYEELPPFDKRPMVFAAVRMKPASGRFARKKRSSGHCGEVAMKRCFTTGGSPSLSPSKSRLVEAVCIHLCSKHLGSTTVSLPENNRKYQSRWKSVLGDYNRLRARLFNSTLLMEKTAITLFNINETTLLRWHKNKERREEVETLHRGKTLPSSLKTSRTTLPKQLKLQEHQTPLMVFAEGQDLTGKVPPKPVTYTAPLPPPKPPSPPPPQTPSTSDYRPVKPKPHQSAVYVDLPPPAAFVILPYGVQQQESPTTSTAGPKAVPKSTYYRHLKKGKYVNPNRKRYSCRKCGKPMEAPHTQYNGRRYCPNEPGALPHAEWLEEQRRLAKEKKEARKV